MHKLEAAVIGAVLSAATVPITPAIAMPKSHLAGASTRLTTEAQKMAEVVPTPYVTPPPPYVPPPASFVPPPPVVYYVRPPPPPPLVWYRPYWPSRPYWGWRRWWW
jgi:hypothetical protein